MPVFKRQALKEKDRKFFTKVKNTIPLPNLIELQLDSYNWFIKNGIKELFEEVSPITDFSGRNLELYFENYYLDEPRFDEMTCKKRNVTFEAPLRITARLTNKATGSTKSQEIYLGDVPMMTQRGTFIVNGIERVIVSQLIRSAGAFFTAQSERGRRYYGAKVIPNRGAWLEIETDINNAIWVKVDRKRKVAITSLLKAFGFDDEDKIRNYFKDVNNHPTIDYIDATLKKDLAKNMDEGLIEVYKRIRPGDLATAENAKGLIHSMFFNFERYDLGRVGVYKFNTKFDLPSKSEDYDNKENRVLSTEKLLAVIKEIIRLNVTQEEPDDVDHLGNRRIRAVGELVQNRFRVGLARMERIVKDRMSTYDVEQLVPNKVINARPVMSAIREFFMSSQMSQFMDQHNPLSELEHKRRLSALGPGGLSRDRASFEVRDVHTTHYGRICPIATPEGPNIGLVNHLSSFARINEFGFIETPYRKVLREVKNDASLTEGEILRGDIGEIKDGTKITKEVAVKLAKEKVAVITVKPRITNEVVYLSAFKEEKYITASAKTKTDDAGYFLEDYVPARVNSKPGVAKTIELEFIDVSSAQIVSIATSCIPFLEHDDATRALMGTNMQRQAVPCIRPEPPLVGTGVEHEAAVYSGQVVIADEDGEIVECDGAHIVLKGKKENHTYNLNKFVRANAATCINQHPTVVVGQKVKKGEFLSNGPSIAQDELALGQNVLVAYMAWDGFNYEDAIKQVQITVADMRKIQVGDKMAGRHGNKGVISKIVPSEDLPFLEDGTPIDIVLSPLGVISRMNLGQLLETHLGLAANALGYKVATPVLNGVTEEQIYEELKKAGLPVSGQAQLYDGRTGEPFDHKTTIGYNYMLKLNHMVEDKIHQRSIGPYSLITQQPLGGKAQFGGQRFGEMEVWALEAYGAAHTLQEILTIKSDDVPGRSKAYEAIIKGEEITRVNIPESFNVLVREIKGLGLDVELLKKNESGVYENVEEVEAQEQKQNKKNENALNDLNSHQATSNK